MLVSAPAALASARLVTRPNNPYGKNVYELARVLRLRQTIEPSSDAPPILEIDRSVPLDQVLERILSLVSE